jgi:hypothetical protein
MTSVNSFGILIGAKEGDGRVIDKLKPAIDNNETDHEWAGKEPMSCTPKMRQR